MLKDRLKAIKADMRDVRGNRAACQGQVRQKLRELEQECREALMECARAYADEGCRLCEQDRINRRFDQLRDIAIGKIYNQWHNDQQYYLIYADGSDVVVSAEDILSGEKLPRLSGIVYAELSSVYDHFDTETGELSWYSEERL